MGNAPVDLRALWALAWSTQRSRYRTRHHGIDHWVRVERNGLWLAGQLPGVDTLVMRCFSALHDCQRHDDGYDPEHGPRAARFIEEMSLALEADQLDRLLTAVRTHTYDWILQEDLTIQVCHDADRLDIGRVGIRPHPKFFYTAPAKALADRDAVEVLDDEELDLTCPEYFKPTPRWDRW
jgi:uncharacterized protein